MEKTATIYNLVFNIVLFVLGILLIIFTKQIFISLGENGLFKDDSGALLVLFLVGTILIIFMYFIGAVLSGLSFFTLVIMLITLVMNKKSSKGVFIHNLVIYCIYMFIIFFMFGSSVLEAENILLSASVVLLLASPFIIGVILNAIGISKSSKKTVDNNEHILVLEK